MKNKIALLLLSILLVGFAYATTPEIVSVYLYDAKSTTYIGNNTWTNGCFQQIGGVSSPNACLDTDTGYDPTSLGVFAGEFILMTPTIQGSITYWNPSGQTQCILGQSEYCDINGNLVEAVCGSSIGIAGSSAFGFAYPNNSWVNNGEPSALVTVNCAGFSRNNPSLNLTGTCNSGRCI